VQNTAPSEIPLFGVCFFCGAFLGVFRVHFDVFKLRLTLDAAEGTLSVVVSVLLPYVVATSWVLAGHCSCSEGTYRHSPFSTSSVPCSSQTETGCFALPTTLVSGVLVHPSDQHSLFSAIVTSPSLPAHSRTHRFHRDIPTSAHNSCTYTHSSSTSANHSSLANSCASRSPIWVSD